MEISITQTLYFGSQVRKKVKILLVCSQIIAYLYSQLEREMIHIFKITNEKFARLSTEIV